VKIGIFGGSFNPIHNGHLEAAKIVQEKLHFNRLILMPSFQTPLKNPDELASPDHRVAMIQLAIQEVPRAECSTLEIDRQGLSYTIDTATQVHRELNEDDELYWIVGLDSFVKIREWKEYQKLFSLMHFVVLIPPGYDFPLGVLPGTLISKYQRGETDEDFASKQGSRIFFYESSLAAMHSTEIRERISSDGNVSKFLPSSVTDYILTNGLYGAQKV